MKIFILFLMFNGLGEVPENYPRKGAYYHSMQECVKSGAKQQDKNPNVTSTRCIEVEVPL